jgi:hypothetical protein
LPHEAIALQIRQNRGCYIFTLLSLHTWPLRFCKNLLCPAALKATIVLPDFIRSCSTDGEEVKLSSSVITRYEAIPNYQSNHAGQKCLVDLHYLSTQIKKA